jgi:hypothetical protein
MGFSVRLAPGVRVRASSRGVRTSLGPRVARVHVGAGRTGFSTGVGPVGYYTGLSGSTRRRSTGTATANRQLAAAARTEAKLEKLAEAERLIQAFDDILDLHREEFSPASPPKVPPPPGVSLPDIQKRRRAEAKRTTSVFARQERRQALEEADRLAVAEAAELTSDLAQQTAKYQAEADAWWESLNRCDPATVLAALAQAFEDNEAAAAAVGVEDREVTLVVVVPSVSAVPERKATTTVAGNLSLKKLTKRETADLYKLLVCGHLMVTLREAFAVVPALQSARIVAVRASDRDSYGKRNPEVIAAAKCERSALNGVRWSDVDAARVLNDCCTEKLIVQRGATAELQPIKLDDEPELSTLLDAVDMTELLES